MGNSLRCCLACVLPCGALDLIRIVHLNGHVEEITRPVTAGEVLKQNPNHVLSKPSSQGILILSPESELKRGSIYFLVPATSTNKKVVHNKNTKNIISSSSKKRPNKKVNNVCDDDVSSEYCDGYITSQKKASRRVRRTGGSGVWQPHLESIHED